MYLSSFFEKSENELVWPFLVFLTILVPQSLDVREYQVLAITRTTCVKLVRTYKFKKIRNHLIVLDFVCTKYSPIEIDQD